MEIQYQLNRAFSDSFQGKKCTNSIKKKRNNLVAQKSQIIKYLFSIFFFCSLTLRNANVIGSIWTQQVVITAIKLGLYSGKHEQWKDYDWPVNGNDVKSVTDNL